MNSGKLAAESEKTQKAREKLRRKFEVLDKKITPEALKDKIKEIHDRIARLSPHRIVLKKKNISLFDENQNTAEFSRRILVVSQKLKEDSLSISQSIKDLNLNKHVIIADNIDV